MQIVHFSAHSTLFLAPNDGANDLLSLLHSCLQAKPLLMSRLPVMDRLACRIVCNCVSEMSRESSVKSDRRLVVLMYGHLLSDKYNLTPLIIHTVVLFIYFNVNIHTMQGEKVSEPLIQQYSHPPSNQIRFAQR